jgi:uncharacterized BrkB/YihY/UPF0761 family membrane protein
MSDPADDEASFPGRTRARIVATRRRLVDRTREALLVVPALDLVWEMGRRYRRLNGSVLAGHLTYRLFLWLAPLTLLLIASFGFGASSALGLESMLGDAGVNGDTSEVLTDQALSSTLYAFWIGAGGLLVASYGLLVALHYVFAQAWEIEIVPRRGIVPAVGKFLASTLVLLLVLLAITAARQHGVVLRVGAAAGSFVVYAAIALAITWVLPRRSSSFVDLLPGTLVVATGASVLHFVAQYYLPHRVSESSQVYGTFGTVLAVLFYLWCIAMLLVGDALVNSVWTDRDAILAGRPMIADPDRISPRLRRVLYRLGAWSSRAGDAATSVEARVRGRTSTGVDDEDHGQTSGADDRVSRPQ